ncbi:uncharacterized protein PHALS_06465 [Plasmopara halstedii]|uniref:Uncharacterized protein n=1 Tax=Plasmopara halstedii TaxID=4781 RepID=A0A0P1B2Z1_PLAHL|nr:uncharacterized protein PHALS_06465 [Plasmopara halstedii]CEG48654.1 hypothetical protein PHALS_06465 [Plasmopara halstedii]|eukprot:XP_024585023.1 hypothetical protein PHALS_06465 [Plasmopara halstedii]
MDFIHVTKKSFRPGVVLASYNDTRIDTKSIAGNSLLLQNLLQRYFLTRSVQYVHQAVY